MAKTTTHIFSRICFAALFTTLSANAQEIMFQSDKALYALPPGNFNFEFSSTKGGYGIYDLFGMTRGVKNDFSISVTNTITTGSSTVYGGFFNGSASLGNILGNFSVTNDAAIGDGYGLYFGPNVTFGLNHLIDSTINVSANYSAYGIQSNTGNTANSRALNVNGNITVYGGMNAYGVYSDNNSVNISADINVSSKRLATGIYTNSLTKSFSYTGDLRVESYGTNTSSKPYAIGIRYIRQNTASPLTLYLDENSNIYTKSQFNNYAFAFYVELDKLTVSSTSKHNITGGIIVASQRFGTGPAAMIVSGGEYVFKSDGYNYIHFAGGDLIDNQRLGGDLTFKDHAITEFQAIVEVGTLNILYESGTSMTFHAESLNDYTFFNLGAKATLNLQEGITATIILDGNIDLFIGGTLEIFQGNTNDIIGTLNDIILKDANGILIDKSLYTVDLENHSVSIIPEPSSFAIAGAALALAFALRRRIRISAKQ